MGTPEGHYDIDSALGRLRQRVRWLRWGALAGLLACIGLWWGVADHALFLMSHPLSPVFTGIDIPAAALNASGTMERGTSATERALAFVGVAIAIVTLVAYRRADRPRRYVVAVAGVALVGLVLAAQWTTGGEMRANHQVERLADAGQYNRLLNHLKSKPPIPYGDYIAAQALVLSGEGARLKADYGPWLQRWGEQAAREGYLGAKAPRIGTSTWEGANASPQVMRALEIRAFGKKAATPFSEVYEREMRARMLDAKSWLLGLVPATVLTTLTWFGLALTWRRGRRNLRWAEKWVFKFDYYDVQDPADEPDTPRRAAALAPRSLPPIEFQPDLLQPASNGPARG